MSDRIIIDFDGEEKEPEKKAEKNDQDSNRILIEFDDTTDETEMQHHEKNQKENQKEDRKESPEEAFLKTKVNCFYKGNSY